MNIQETLRHNERLCEWETSKSTELMQRVKERESLYDSVYDYESTKYSSPFVQLEHFWERIECLLLWPNDLKCLNWFQGNFSRRQHLLLIDSIEEESKRESQSKNVLMPFSFRKYSIRIPSCPWKLGMNERESDSNYLFFLKGCQILII